MQNPCCLDDLSLRRTTRQCWGDRRRGRGRGGAHSRMDLGVKAERRWWQRDYEMPHLLSGKDNYRFDGNLTQTIRFFINTIRTLQLQHSVSFIYQPCWSMIGHVKNANPYVWIEKHNQEQEKQQLNCRRMINQELEVRVPWTNKQQNYNDKNNLIRRAYSLYMMYLYNFYYYLKLT